MKKRMICMIVSCLLVLGLAACAQVDPEPAKESEPPAVTTEPTAAPTEAPTETPIETPTEPAVTVEDPAQAALALAQNYMIPLRSSIEQYSAVNRLSVEPENVWLICTQDNALSWAALYDIELAKPLSEDVQNVLLGYETVETDTGLRAFFTGTAQFENGSWQSGYVMNDGIALPNHTQDTALYDGLPRGDTTDLRVSAADGRQAAVLLSHALFRAQFDSIPTEDHMYALSGKALSDDGVYVQWVTDELVQFTMIGVVKPTTAAGWEAYSIPAGSVMHPDLYGGVYADYSGWLTVGLVATAGKTAGGDWKLLSFGSGGGWEDPSLIPEGYYAEQLAQ